MGRVGKSGGQGSGISPRPPVKKSVAKAARPTPNRTKSIARPAPKRFTNTDTGNTERLHHYYGRDLKYVTSWHQFITWSGSVWKPDEGGGAMLRLTKQAVTTIKDDAVALAKIDDKESKKKNAKKAQGLFGWWKQSEGMARREAMIRGIRGERGVEIDHHVLDADPWLLGVGDGVVDLRTGKKQINDRKFMLTKRTPVPYKPGAKAPRWQAFLKQVMPDAEIRDFIQRFVGYSLTGIVTERMFLILFGGGRNGKSVFLHTLQRLMGPYAISTAPGLLMAKGEAHPTEVADLFGTRLAVANEIKKGRVFDEEQVKRLTGNDVIKARKMRENFWEFEPTFKLMLAANHKPQVRDDSDSFWDRLALIPFEVRIAEGKVDKHLQDKLKLELPGILAWAVEGCLKWQKLGLERPKAVMAATKEYRSNEDTLGKFFEEECRFAANYETSTAMLAVRLKQWCEGNNLVYTFKEKDLAEKLAENNCVRAVIGPKIARVRGWKGLGLVKHVNGKTLEPFESMPTGKDAGKKPGGGGSGGKGGPPGKPGSKGSPSLPPPPEEIEQVGPVERPTKSAAAKSAKSGKPVTSLMDRIRNSKGEPRRETTAPKLDDDDDEEYTTD